jgi:hypothetical protein
MQTYSFTAYSEMNPALFPVLVTLQQYMEKQYICEFFYREDTESRLMYIHSIKPMANGRVVYIKAYKYENDKKVWRTFILNRMRLVSKFVTCHGCVEEQPNQLAHMGLGGCLCDY